MRNPGKIARGGPRASQAAKKSRRRRPRRRRDGPKGLLPRHSWGLSDLFCDAALHWRGVSDFPVILNLACNTHMVVLHFGMGSIAVMWNAVSRACFFEEALSKLLPCLFWLWLVEESLPFLRTPCSPILIWSCCVLITVAVEMLKSLLLYPSSPTESILFGTV